MANEKAAREAARQKALFYGEPTPEEEEHRRQDEARWKSLERKIEKKEGAGRDLDTLENAGVPRKRLLRLLAVTVDALKDRDSALAELARDKRDELRRLAKHMGACAREADKAVADSLLKVQWWAYLMGHGWALGMKLPHPQPWKDDPEVRFVVSGIRELSKQFQRESRKFGRFLREFARKDAQTPVALLLLSVFFMRFRQGGVRKPDHLSELTRLLTDAIEVAEINKYGSPRAGSPEKDNYFTADSLGKLWERRGKRMLRRWYKLNFPAPQSEKPEPSLAVRPLGFLAPPKLVPPPTD